jgi:hypothetical protein
MKPAQPGNRSKNGWVQLVQFPNRFLSTKIELDQQQSCGGFFYVTATAKQGKAIPKVLPLYDPQLRIAKWWPKLWI